MHENPWPMGMDIEINVCNVLFRLFLFLFPDWASYDWLMPILAAFRVIVNYIAAILFDLGYEQMKYHFPVYGVRLSAAVAAYSCHK